MTMPMTPASSITWQFLCFVYSPEPPHEFFVCPPPVAEGPRLAWSEPGVPIDPDWLAAVVSDQGTALGSSRGPQYASDHVARRRVVSP